MPADNRIANMTDTDMTMTDMNMTDTLMTDTVTFQTATSSNSSHPQCFGGVFFACSFFILISLSLSSCYIL